MDAKTAIDYYDLMDKDPDEFLKCELEAYGLDHSQIFVVKPHEIHSMLTVNLQNINNLKRGTSPMIEVVPIV